MNRAFQFLLSRQSSIVSAALGSLRRPMSSRPAILMAILVIGSQMALALIPGTGTTLAVTSSGSPVATVASGHVVSLTATVTGGGSSITTGRVKFCDAAATYCTDVHLLGEAQLTSAGTAIYRFVPAAGAHTYKAVFVGTQTHTASASSSVALQVTGSYATTTTITPSGSTGNYTLTGTVTSAPGSGTAPTGSVSFLDVTNANYSLASVPLAGAPSVLSYLTASTPSTDADPFALVVGDFNNDGISDIATADNGADQLTILLGNGDGTFTAAASPSTGSNPYAITVGDLNGDGRLDLAVSNIADGTVTILLGNGNGTFTAAALISLAAGSAPGAIIVADLNNDGILDLAVAEETTNQIFIFHGNGDGTFVSGTSLSTTLPVGSPPLAMATGDINNDGFPDLVVLSAGNQINPFIGTSSGNFTALARFSPPATEAVSLALADVDGNGRLDLILADYASSTAVILLGDGSGGFTPSASAPTTGLGPYSLAIGDLNGDGFADITTANFADGSVSVLLGKGDGTFTAAASPSVGSYPYAIATGVFSADGSVAPAIADLGDSTVTVLHGEITQTATATATGVSPLGTGTHSVKASYAGDSVYSSSMSATTNLNAQQLASTLALIANPTPSTAGQLVTLTATLSPSAAQGQTASGTVVFYNGSTALGSSSIASGVSTLALATLPTGTDLLSAVYSGDTHFLTSTSNTVSQVVNPVVNKTQTITFPPLSAHFFNPPPIPLGATASSGLPVTYTVTLGQATVSGNNVLVKSGYSGLVRITANQAGNGTYLAAPAVSQYFDVLPQGFSWTPMPIVYGTKFSVLMTATAGVPGSFVYTYAGTPLTGNKIFAVGSYVLIANFTPTGNGPMIKIPETITVTPATLTVTAHNETATYSAQVPAYTYAITGYVNGDPSSVVTGVPSITTTATIRATPTRGLVILTSPVGTYSINPHWGSLATNKNYKFAFAPGTLTITPSTSPLTITARNVTVANASLIPTNFTYTVAGQVGFDNWLTAGTGTPSLTTTATNSSAPGTYPITVAAGSFAAPNYATVHFVNGTLTIK